MKKILSILFITAASGMIFLACKKVADLPYYSDGSAVTLTANKTSIAPVLGDSANNVITFSWSSPKYASDSTTWKFLLQADTNSNFATRHTIEYTGTSGGSITGKQLNDILLNFSVQPGTPKDIYFRVISSYSNNNERYTSNTLKIPVTPYSHPAVLSSENTSVSGSLATSGNHSNTFSWTPAFSGYTGDITYTLQYDSATKSFASPKDIPVGVNLTSKSMTQGEMNSTALNSGITGGNTGKVEYRVKAVTAQGAVAYSNTVSVNIQSFVAIIRLYLPGGYQSATGNGSDWDPGSAPEMIRDQRTGLFNNMYYTYFYLPAGAEFKVTLGQSWTTNWGKGSTANSIAPNGANFSVTTAGVYRFTIDINTMTYDLRQGRMGFVGGAVGAGWTPSNVFPNYEMGYSSRNLFVGTADFTNDGWKMIDNDQWNSGSNTVDETRSYGSNGPSGSSLLVNGPNMPNPPGGAGRYRVIWDGRNADDVKYSMMTATEMRVVGNGLTGVPDWNPGASPQMTWMGNGIWQITLPLDANEEIKFLAGAAWGDFDYEDASGGSNATGVARKMQFEGGPNFKTPAVAGTYTITLNERTQTVTIN
ncbi:MAG TPA: SusE domain-containing protein [Chitinophagaceae bacterium]